MRGFEVDYDRRLRAMIDRRTAPVEMRAKGAYSPPEYYQASPIYEVYNKLQQEGTAVRYAVGAMQRVDPRYTEITYEQGDRVKNQLDKAFRDADMQCDFEYQGSVTNDTHIKAHSDIDLLAITCLFVTLEPPQKAQFPYNGDPVKDLKDIRTVGVTCLKNKFPTAEVDESGSKAVAISGGSLRRKIDVVPANWYDTNSYARTQAKRHRSVQVLDVRSGKRITNSPFLHNYLIEQRDASVSGGLRKVIRLMKSLKYDGESISLSSYDLASIGYNMPEYHLITFPGGEISLLARLKTFLDELREDRETRSAMRVPDGSRLVFCEGHATLDGLDELRDEVDDLVEAVSQNRLRSFDKLFEARVAY